MIGLIKGEVYALNAPTACILTASGVGYEIELPLSSFCQLELGNEITLWTHFLVREDAQQLYGFIYPQDRLVFRQLIKINGVGAKMALAILSTMNVAELKHHVTQKSENALVRIPGVGKKTAQRLIIELKDKLADIEIDPTSAHFSPDFIASETDNPSDNLPDLNANNALKSVFKEVISGLISLGYKEKEAETAVKNAHQTNPDLADTQSLLKATLRQLANF